MLYSSRITHEDGLTFESSAHVNPYMKQSIYETILSCSPPPQSDSNVFARVSIGSPGGTADAILIPVVLYSYMLCAVVLGVGWHVDPHGCSHAIPTIAPRNYASIGSRICVGFTLTPNGKGCVDLSHLTMERGIF